MNSPAEGKLLLVHEIPEHVRRAIAVAVEENILIATSRSSVVSRTREDLTHAAFADAGDNFVDTRDGYPGVRAKR